MRKAELFVVLLIVCVLSSCTAGAGNNGSQLAATHFSVTAMASATLGTPISVMVTALDAAGGTATAYSGTVHFTSSDPQAMLPANSALTNGTGTFPVTLKTAGNQTITVTDTVTASIAGTSNSVTVNAVPMATHFSVSVPASASAGSAFNFTVTALDASNNQVNSYSGTVHFTSSDPQAVLPANSTLSNGAGTFSATLMTTGNQTLAASDVAQSSISGISNSINVSVLTKLSITSGTPPSGTVGVGYGPTTTESESCVFSPILGWHVVCIPCSSPSACASLPPCGTRLGIKPCREIEDIAAFSLTASGGAEPYIWSWRAAAGASLPPGLSFTQGGEISGTPTSPGTYNVVVTVTASSSPAEQSSANYAIIIAPPPPPAINVASPPIGTVNSPYVGFTFTASGGFPPLTWSETGALPAGMQLSPAGVLSGTPTADGSFPITVVAQDSVGQNSAPQGFAIQILAQGFTPTGSMEAERVWDTATLLANGTVLVTGGASSTGFASTAEVYDESTAKFAQTTGNPTTVRTSATATLLASGKVLVAGGKDGNGEELATSELYDPSTETFAATSGNMSDGRAYHTATLLNDGTVLVTGGLDQAGDSTGTPVATAEIYDPATNSFALTGAMTAARFLHTAALLGNGNVLIAGGLNADGALDSAEVYDPATKTFTSTGTMTMARAGHAATVLGSGKVLLTGGSNGFGGDATNATELYDPSSGSFTAASVMINARSAHTATLLQNGQVLVAGGSSTFYGGGESTSLSAAELFDPTTGNFSATADMTALREFHTATLLNTGEVLVVGGSNGTLGYSAAVTVLATAELYQ